MSEPQHGFGIISPVMTTRALLVIFIGGSILANSAVAGAAETRLLKSNPAKDEGWLGPRAIESAGVWPLIVELDLGETAPVVLGQDTNMITLREVKHQWQPDYWILGNDAQRTLLAARVDLTVNQQALSLWLRPYQSPVVVGRLRLYVETTRQWAAAEHAALTDMHKQVRLSVRPAGQPWGPPEMRFPIRNYRWGSSSYQNTWASLVPYNRLYYHRGEDLGAIPDRLPVQAMSDGQVVDSPAGANAPSGSNRFTVRCKDGIEISLSHMNLGSIDPALVVGAQVRAAQAVGKTGSTLAGAERQHDDPHLHVEFRRGERRFGSFPLLVESYFREYEDSLIALAGGYRFALPAEAVQLDGTRSLARPGRRIVKWVWRLHDGRRIEQPITEVTYQRPGLYSEHLEVHSDDGRTAHDFLQVRVYDPARGRDIATGWVYHNPVRGLRCGEPVLIWNRLANTRSPVMIDLGDGTPPRPIEQDTTHCYHALGTHIVTFTSTGPGTGSEQEVVLLKMPIVVDERRQKANRRRD